MESLEDETDLLAPHLGQRPLAQPVDPSPAEPQLAAGWAVEPTEKVEQRGLPAATGSHHGDRLTEGDIEIDAVDGADESFVSAVLLAQAASAGDRVVGHCLMLLRSVQLRSQASSQRKSAWSLSAMPSSSRAAFE